MGAVGHTAGSADYMVGGVEVKVSRRNNTTPLRVPNDCLLSLRVPRYATRPGLQNRTHAIAENHTDMEKARLTTGSNRVHYGVCDIDGRYGGSGRCSDVVSVTRRRPYGQRRRTKRKSSRFRASASRISQSSQEVTLPHCRHSALLPRRHSDCSACIHSAISILQGRIQRLTSTTWFQSPPSPIPANNAKNSGNLLKLTDLDSNWSPILLRRKAALHYLSRTMSSPRF